MRFIWILSIVILNSYAQNKIPIAVLDLQGEGISSSETRILTSRLRTDLFNSGRFVVLEREQMDEILNEQGFQISGCTSNECVVEIGRILGVKNMIAGDIGKIGSLYTINLRMIDVESSKILKTATDDCSCSIEIVLTKSIKKVALILANQKFSYSNEANQSNLSDGKLFLTSVPTGASVYLNKKKIGSTPLKSDSIPIGSQELIFSKDGYAPLRKTISISNKKTTEVSISLTKIFPVSIKSNPSDAVVYIDKEPMGQTPYKTFYKANEKISILIKKDGYAHWIQEITIDGPIYRNIELVSKAEFLKDLGF